MREPQQKAQRCAIYTRKSTEHNLDLAFNSLDAQREACEAYIKSQAHEGWRLVPDRFDDGGLSGASLERPALQQLLDAVRAGRIDIIVVYKVDRLTRSLADFAKLVELFDQHGVSFVSVTQSLNTTSSMGRLTLNVLLSFAQFEREVIGERVRDKIAASKAKGIWVGGPVPLGYRSQGKKLVADPEEAELVRSIFTLYRERGAIGAVVEALRERGVRSRKGSAFTVGPINYILRNRLYVGEVVHRGGTSRGEHVPIVPAKLFSAVQNLLSEANVKRRATARSSASILVGLLHDDAGNHMSPSHARKNGVRYRYYVSQALIQHRKAEAGSVPRVSAPELEAAVLAALGLGSDSPPDPSATASWLNDRIARITLHRGNIVIAWKQQQDDADGPVPAPTLTAPFIWQPQKREKGVAREPSQRPRLDPSAAQALLAGIARGRRWVEALADGHDTVETIANREQLGERHVRRILPLACLSPRIIEAIAMGNAPSNLTVSALTADLPHDWASQDRRFLGV